MAVLGVLYLLTALVKHFVEHYFEFKKHIADNGAEFIRGIRGEIDPDPDPDEEQEEQEQEEEPIRGPSVWDRIKDLRGK